MKESATRNRKIEFSMGVLFFYIVWWVDFQHTIFCTSTMVYVAFVLLLLIFIGTLIAVVSFRKITVTKTAAIPLIFLIYTLGCNFIVGDYEYLTYKLVCLIILILGMNAPNFYKAYNIKAFIYFGIVGVIGIAFQALALPLYNSVIAPIFTNQNTISYLGTVGHYNGFFYQWGLIAAVLAYGIGVLLFLPTRFNEKNSLKWVIYGIFVIAIFSTGKRSLSLLAVIVPIIVNIVSQNSLSRRVKIFFFFVISLLGILWFINTKNISFGLSSLDRLSDTIKAIISNEGVLDDGRIGLSEKAKELFRANPIFGIGINRFRTISGMETDVHNVYLQVLCEQGLIGIVLFVAGCLTSLFTTIKCIKSKRYINNQSMLKMALYMQLLFLLNGFFENELINLCASMLYYTSVATCESIIINQYREENEKWFAI